MYINANRLQSIYYDRDLMYVHQEGYTISNSGDLKLTWSFKNALILTLYIDTSILCGKVCNCMSLQPRPVESLIYVIYSSTNRTILTTAIAFEIFEIYELTKSWTLGAFETVDIKPSSAILKRLKFRQLNVGDFDSVERSEILTVSNARRFRQFRTLGDFDSFERSEISTSNAKNGDCMHLSRSLIYIFESLNKRIISKS